LIPSQRASGRYEPSGDELGETGRLFSASVPHIAPALVGNPFPFTFIIFGSDESRHHFPAMGLHSCLHPWGDFGGANHN
jgi:hypothetical protein